MIVEFFIGLRFWQRAHVVMRDYNLRRYLFFSGAVGFTYMTAYLVCAGLYAPEFSTYIVERFDFLSGEFIRTLLAVIFGIGFLFFGLVTFRYVILTLLSPTLSDLSAAAEAKMTGGSVPEFRWGVFFRDLGRGLGMNLRYLFRELLFSLLAWLLVLIPVAGVFLATGAILLVQGYYGGCGLCDFSLERKGYSMRERVEFVRRFRWRIIGAGVGFVLVLMVPVLGWIAAPAYATVATTLLVLESAMVEGG